MCGIAGWIDHSQDMSERIDLLNRMSETLDRRGPDENGGVPHYQGFKSLACSFKRLFSFTGFPAKILLLILVCRQLSASLLKVVDKSPTGVKNFRYLAINKKK